MDSVVFPELPTFLFDPSVAGVLSLLLTIVLPLLAALLMKASWSTFVKGLVLLLLAAVKAFLEAALGAAQADVPFHFLETAYAALVNFGIAVGMYFGLLKGTAVQQAAMRSGVRDNRTIDGTYTPRNR